MARDNSAGQLNDAAWLGEVGDGTTLVIEAGGTTLRAGLFNPDTHAVSRRRTMSSPNYLTFTGNDVTAEMLAAMRRLGERVTQRSPEVVSVAYPGPVKDGVVLAAPTVTGEMGRPPFSLTSECQRLWPGAAIHTLNDLTAAGLRLVDAGMSDFAVITIGSGVGHKVFVRGRPQLGEGGRGGEIGHLRLDLSPNAPLCDCGGRGHVGSLASARGTLARARVLAASQPEMWHQSTLSERVAHSSQITGTSFAAAYQAGDSFARSVISDTVPYLGQAIAAIHLDTGTEQFVLMGGFPAALGEDYLAEVASAARAASWDVGQEWDQMVTFGPSDDDSALIGAGLLAHGLV